MDAARRYDPINGITVCLLAHTLLSDSLVFAN